MRPSLNGTAWTTHWPSTSRRHGPSWRPSVRRLRRRYGGTSSKSRSRPFSDLVQRAILLRHAEGCHACGHQKLFWQRHEGAFRPLGEEQRRSGKSHPRGKGFRELFPRTHHSRRVLGLGIPGQGWCRREHSGSTGVDRQECQQNWCGPTNYLGRHSHAAIEVNLSLSETYALKYWWCSPPRTLRAISNHCDEDALTLLSPSLP